MKKLQSELFYLSTSTPVIIGKITIPTLHYGVSGIQEMDIHCDLLTYAMFICLAGYYQRVYNFTAVVTGIGINGFSQPCFSLKDHIFNLVWPHPQNLLSLVIALQPGPTHPPNSTFTCQRLTTYEVWFFGGIMWSFCHRLLLINWNSLQIN